MWAGIQFQRKQEFMPNYYASDPPDGNPEAWSHRATAEFK